MKRKKEKKRKTINENFSIAYTRLTATSAWNVELKKITGRSPLYTCWNTTCDEEAKIIVYSWLGPQYVELHNVTHVRRCDGYSAVAMRRCIRPVSHIGALTNAVVQLRNDSTNLWQEINKFIWIQLNGCMKWCVCVGVYVWVSENERRRDWMAVEQGQKNDVRNKFNSPFRTIYHGRITEMHGSDRHTMTAK